MLRVYPLTKTMRCRERTKRPGDVLPLRDSYHYPLPSGLKPGMMVKLMRHEAGYWIVESNGKHFTVFKTLVDAGFDYEFQGRWLPESDPRIRALREQETLVNSRAYSCVAGGCVNPPV